MSALGFIETLGLLPAIEAADAMLKAAEVRLVGRQCAGGGLVTVMVAGEVAAVAAAVDAGAASVERFAGALRSRLVIARPDPSLGDTVVLPPHGGGCVGREERRARAAAAPVANSASPALAAPETPSASETAPQETAEPLVYTESQLKKMSLKRLRALAAATDGLPLTPAETGRATRAALINALSNAYRQTEE